MPERPVAVRALPAHLPREEVVHEPATGSCACPSCGGVLRPLGRGADELLDVVPVSWRVVRHVRPPPAFQRCCASLEPCRLATPKYSCRSCERIVQAPAPVKAIARGKATLGTLAHVVVSKFDHHLSLYRQAEMMAAQGVELDRSTLSGGTGQGSSYAKHSWKAGGGWTGQAAALLDPIVSRIRDEGLKATKIHTDDTPVPVLDPGRGRTATGRLWVYAVDDRASGATTPPLVWYRFTPDRSGTHPQRELAAFSGHLQADAYAGYNKLYESGRIAEVACWGHFRRGFFDIHRAKATPLTTDSSSASASSTPLSPAYAVSRRMSGRECGRNRVGRWPSRFEAGDRRYGLPDPEWPDDELAAAKNVKLGTLIERGVREMTYTYDMGDNWEHGITVEAVRPADPATKYPRFIDGARRCPPKDVGGTPGYENFLDAMADPNHEEHADVREWYGGPYDPDNIDELITKRRVAAIPIRPAAGKAAYAKRRA